MEDAYLSELENKRSAVAFRNRRLESEYRAYVSRRSELNVRRQLALAATMLLGATGLDFALLPSDFAITGAELRASIAFPPMIAAFLLTYVPRALWLRQLTGVLTALAVGLTSLAVAELAGRAAHPAFAGAFMIVVFTFFFLGLHYAIAAMTGFALVAAYVLLAYTIGVAPTTIAYTGYSLLVMNVICAIGAGQLELARRRDFLKERVLSYRAAVDALSTLANRRAFDLRLTDSWKNAAENQTSLVLFLIDIDHFKTYNDHYGHQAGDRAIQRVGQVLKRVLRRPEDFASRYGGEEFAVILVGVDRDAALALADRIREQVLGERIEHVQSTAAEVVSVSIGVAHLFPHATERSEKGFVQLADQALYSAKQRGRNRVEGAAESSAEGTGVFKVPAPGTAPDASALP